MPDHPLFIWIGDGPALQRIHCLKCLSHGRRHPFDESVVEAHTTDVQRKPERRHAAQMTLVSLPELCGVHESCSVGQLRHWLPPMSRATASVTRLVISGRSAF